LVLALLIAHPALANQQGANDGQAIATETASKPPPAAPSLDPPASADVYAKSCEHPKNTDQANLCIERSSMKATQQQAFWAKLTFVITTLGTAAVVTTLVYTAVAARAAQTAAEATVASVKAAQRSADAAEKAGHTERAWVFYEGLRLGDAPEADVFGTIRDVFVIYVSWINGGRTPAVKANLYATAQIIDTNIPPPLFRWSFPAESNVIIGQGKVATTYQCFVSDVEIALARARKKRLVVYSKVEYFDVFNKDIVRLSEATFFIDFNGELVDKDGRRTENIATGFFGPQNGCT
jgi:hypothetical protein